MGALKFVEEPEKVNGTITVVIIQKHWKKYKFIKITLFGNTGISNDLELKYHKLPFYVLKIINSLLAKTVFLRCLKSWKTLSMEARLYIHTCKKYHIKVDLY